MKSKKPIPVKKRKNILKTIFYHINYIIRLFLEQSGIHGFGYLIKYTTFEKCFWLILVILSLVGCTLISLQSLDRYKNKSTVMSLETDYYYWNTTIPSMTICPLARLNDTKFNNYMNDIQIYENKTRKEIWEFLESMANSTYINFENIQVYDSIEKYTKKYNIKPQDYMTLIYNLTENLSALGIVYGYSADIRINQILTEYGICYNANNYLTHKLSANYLILGKEPNYNNNFLSIAFVGNIFDYSNVYSLLGFRDAAVAVFIHSPFETMQIEKSHGDYEFYVNYETQTVDIITSDDFEHATSISQRRCRFAHESNLTHFQIYTKNNCLQECRLNLAKKLCGCIPHFYPNRIAHPDTVCHYRTLKTCFPKHKEEFLQISKNGACYCFDNCRDSEFIIYKEMRVTLHDTKTAFGSNGSGITVKNYPKIRLKRQVLFTFTDLLVSIGGTAGLFLGFSVLSVIEIIYFFTLRFFWYSRGYK